MTTHPARAPLWRTTALLLVLFTVGQSPALARQTPLPQGDGMISLMDATLTITDAPSPPPLATGHMVTLGDYWQADRYRQGRVGWYQMPVAPPDSPDAVWGIYLYRFNMNAQLYFNGQFLAADGRFDDPMSRNWNRPLYATIPPALWRESGNLVQVRLKSDPNHGHLAPVLIGPEAQLKPHYERRVFLQNQVSAILFVVILCMSAFMLTLWARRREDRRYLWFGLSCLGWSFYSLNMVIRDIPVPTPLWEVFSKSSTIWWTVLMSLFLLEYAGRLPTRLRRGLLAFATLATLSYPFIDLAQLNRTALTWLIGSILIGLYTLWILLVEWRRQRRATLGFLALAVLAIVTTGVHDWMLAARLHDTMMQMGMASKEWLYSFPISHYTAPILFLFIAWHLVERFVTAMLQREAAAKERQRVAREIHDGMGGHFANAMMLADIVERETSEGRLEDAKTRLARLHSVLDEGLSELRHFITSMADETKTVGSLADYMRQKTEQLDCADGTRFALTATLINGDRTLSYSQQFNTMRIFQELLTNISKHAGAAQATVTVSDRNDTLTLTVTDNGSGYDTTARGGHGLTNMRYRAAEMGATLTVESSPEGGTRTLLILPL